jgi:hypothetical protein
LAGKVGDKNGMKNTTLPFLERVARRTGFRIEHGMAGNGKMPDGFSIKAVKLDFKRFVTVICNDTK